MKNAFRGGIHPPDHKDLTRDCPLQVLEAKGEMVFPLMQHIGKPARALVKKGDAVLVGQLIAEADGPVSAGIACSCSGKVKVLEKRRVQNGRMVESIVVENDGLYTLSGGVGVRQDLQEIAVSEIIRRVRDAGIVGLGGAGFPTHVKLSPQNPEAIRYVIANGSECEPYLTAVDQLMRTYPETVIEGLSLMLRVFPNAQGVVAVGDNKPEAFSAMQKAASSHPRITVIKVKTVYGQGCEKMLIETVAGIRYPAAMLPAEVGCIVQNIGTVYAIDRAVAWNEPLFSHILTLGGDAVEKPGNYLVRDGMSFSELIEAAGGLKEGAVVKKAIVGGPVMGIAVSSLDSPVQKTTNSLTLLTEDECEAADAAMTSCLRCGRCTTVCPVGLMPQLLADAVVSSDLERYEKKLYGLECIQCGCCSYICPAKRPLTQTFMRTKAEIMARKRAEAGGKS